MTIEVCTDVLEAVLGAKAAGANRIELVGNLAEGGTTPSQGMIEIACKASGLPVMVMIRPRPGNFCYSEAEFEQMKREADLAGAAGATGVVFGMLTQSGALDLERSGQFVEYVQPLETTFHRAFDLLADPYQGMHDLIQMGVDRILTSGQKNTAMEGINLLQELQRLARGRIKILPGSGINETNVAPLVKKTGVQEVHFSASSYQTASNKTIQTLPSSEESPVFLHKKIQRIRQILDIRATA